MDSKTFIARLSKRLNADVKNTSALVNAFTNVIGERCADMDTIAIPGFGNFTSTKRSEQVAVDRITGKRTLMPPNIKLQFSASAMLKKQMENE